MQATFETYKKGFLSNSASDIETLTLINEIYTSENYLLDPHGAVSLQAADVLKRIREGEINLFSNSTSSKVPGNYKESINNKRLPSQATHNSIRNC